MPAQPKPTAPPPKASFVQSRKSFPRSANGNGKHANPQASPHKPSRKSTSGDATTSFLEMIDRGAAKYKKMQDGEQSMGDNDNRGGSKFAKGFDPDNNHCIIIPDEKSWKVQWDILMLVLILYSTVSVPVRVCFPGADAEGWVWYFEVTMSFCFIFDCLFSFRLAYLDGGLWVTDGGLIAQNYLRGWFWIDAPSSLPIELLDLVAGADTQQFAMLRFLRMFRLLRLLKLLKLNDILEQLEDLMQTNLKGFRLIFEVCKMLFFAHLLGCFWFGVSAASRTAYLGGDEHTPTWIEMYEANNAGIFAEGQTPSTSQLYLWSVYWAITTLTTVGYGDITPQNDAERVYASFSLLIGGFVFGLMLSNVGVLVASFDRQGAIIEAKMDSVKEYSAARELPADLAMRLKKHFKYYHSRTPAFNEVDLLSECPPLLRAEVEMHITKNTLGKVPLMARLDPDFQSEIFPYIKPVSFSPGDVIFKKGEPSRELLFLVWGSVNVMSVMQDHVVEKRVTPTERSSSRRTRRPQPTSQSSSAPSMASSATTCCAGSGARPRTLRSQTATHSPSRGPT